MIQPQTQMLDFYRAGMRTFADLAKNSLENAEKLQNRQLQILRSAIEDNTRSASDLAQVKSLDEMMALQTRLAIRVYDRNASPFLLGVIDILGCYGLVVRSVAAEEDKQVRANPIPVRACRCRYPERLF